MIKRIVPNYWPTEVLFVEAKIVDYVENCVVFYKYVCLQERIPDWRPSIDFDDLEDVEF